MLLLLNLGLNFHDICKLRLVDYIKYFTKTLKGISFEIPPGISTSS